MLGKLIGQDEMSNKLTKQREEEVIELIRSLATERIELIEEVEDVHLKLSEFGIGGQHLPLISRVELLISACQPKGQ